MSESQLQKLESSIQSLRKDVPFGNQVRKASEACNDIKQFLQQHEEVMLQGKNGPEPNPWLAKNSGCPVL